MRKHLTASNAIPIIIISAALATAVRVQVEAPIEGFYFCWGYFLVLVTLAAIMGYQAKF